MTNQNPPVSKPMGLLAAAADLLLGAACPGCATPGLGICDGCQERLLAQQPRLLPRPDFPVVSHGPYRPPVSTLINAYKEREAWWLAKTLGAQLAAASAELITAGGLVILVPIPCDPQKIRARGIDPMWRVGRSAQRILSHQAKLPEVRCVRLLRQTRQVAEQSALSRDQRWHNQAGALAVRPYPVPAAAQVIIIDDISTTGATLSEAARALTAARIPLLGGAVIADARIRAAQALGSERGR